MDQWAILTVGALAVLAAWDFGRRLTLKTSHEMLSARVDALSRLLDVNIKSHGSTVERVEAVEAKLKGLASKQEMQQAAVKRGFPRIG